MNFIVMGVAGCGKSTVAKALSKRLNLDFLEGDDFHSAENVALMSAGLALTDIHRQPWLQCLNHKMVLKCKCQQRFVLACSALKKSYRVRLVKGVSPIMFIYLKGSKALITRRFSERKDHFMPTNLIDSQFEALEQPCPSEPVITIDIDSPVAEIIEKIIGSIKTRI